MPGVNLVNDGAALQSMRDSDFDAYSAIGEVIDNALQAEAKNVRIQIDFKTHQARRGTEPITAISFGDDGLGMPKDILLKCLQLGYSSRYNDRTGSLCARSSDVDLFETLRANHIGKAGARHRFHRLPNQPVELAITNDF
jgi:sensor histidine kinase regulating citrate/malate metabolism